MRDSSSFSFQAIGLYNVLAITIQHPLSQPHEIKVPLQSYYALKRSNLQLFGYFLRSLGIMRGSTQIREDRVQA